jgi:hypothetical protein
MAEERGRRVVRLVDLTEPQRRLVLALIEAGQQAESIGSGLGRSFKRSAERRRRP